LGAALALLVSGAGAAPDTASQILAGARRELERRTAYDLTMGYHATRFRGGVDTGHRVYPGGDIDPAIGVCADLPIRALRQAGVDLQKLVHEDMARTPDAYRVDPRQLDTNLDHRRVANLFVFFRRQARSLSTGTAAPALAGWQAGDIVVWQLKGYGRTDHIGIISDRRDPASGRPLVIHSFPTPGYVAEEDVLTRWTIAGHFRYPAP
jgi:hypothetical protein